jgi:flotillin
MLDGLVELVGGGVLPIVFSIVVVVLILAYAGSRWKVAGQNEAFVISGARTRTEEGEHRVKVVVGSGVFVRPLLDRVQKLNLNLRQINVNLSDAVSRQGIKVSVQGVAAVKVGSDEESIRNAAERFVGREGDIDSIVKNVLEGSLRSIVGTLTVEELNLDRQKFQQAVQDAAKGDLQVSGLAIDSFTIQAIRDEVGYMELIGQQETARRERDARVAKAAADQEAAVREAEANQVKINAERDVAVRRAETDMQIAAAEARAAQAGPLAQAEAQQEVTRRQTELAQLEAERKAKELLASTVRPAEAEADAQVKRAEGDKLARIAQAQADAERVKLAGQAEASVQVAKGEAQARVVEVNAEATAKQVALEGNAEAGVVFTKGEAEAKALALRADAYRQFNDAAIISTVLGMLPEVVRAAAEPMSHIDNLTVLSSDGATDVVKTATRTVAEASAAVKGLTGIDVPALLGGALEGAVGAGRPGAGGPASGGRVPADVGPAPARPAPRRRGGDDDGGSGPTGGAGSSGSAPSGGGGDAGAGPAGAGPSGSAATPEERFAQAGEAMRRAAARTADALPAAATAGLTSALPPHPPVSDARPSDRRRAAVEAAAAAMGVGRETTLDDAATRLAEELRVIPGIERFGGTRLGDLDRSGPRTLRTLWRIAQERIDPAYREVTIGALLDRYERGRGGTPAGR